ncbi:MAG TPA: universal stress protein [Solirubrobacteraceae bacterium]|nr:universal stress protein [Solirubrobacteraceae bacterium]
MFQNVLVGVDGEPNARDAIALALRLTGSDGKLSLGYVRRGEAAKEREDADKLLARERTLADVKAELLSVVSTSPGRGLHEQAEELGADLLVVGSCHHGALGRAMLGDDTRAALNGASCAVAIASVGYAQHSRPIARVGVAYNTSPESEAAVAVARELAARTGATVHALEVVPIPFHPFTGLISPVVGEGLDAILEEATARMKALAGVDGQAVYGLPGEELAAFGEQMDILVVGSRGYGPMRRLVAGTTSEFLERHARCSLLVLPRSAAAPTADPTASSGLQAETPAATAT